MVTPHRKFRLSSPARSAGVLAAACFGACLVLAGCDAGVETAREAQRDANQAARQAASAGKPRATDKLLDAVASTPLSDLGRLESEAKGKAREWVERQSAEKDLADASQQINRAIKSDLEPGVKSSLQAEAGAIWLQLASERFNGVHAKMEEVTRRALQLQSMAALATDLGNEAKAISATVKAPTGDEVEKAKAAVESTKAAVAKAQEEVTRIEGEIKSKQEQARAIYSKTESAFQAADNLKGKEAIDATNKSVDERKQGDALMAEAGNLEPQLSQARTALAIAQVQAKDAERQQVTATSSYEAGNAWVKQNNDRTAALEAQAKKIISDPNGVGEQFTQLVKLVNDLEPEIASAADAATQSQSAYGAAKAAHMSAMSAVSAKAADRGLESTDPLVRLARDVRGAALLSWGQAAAAEEAGRIHAAGYTAANIVSTVGTLVAKANQAAGLPAAQVALPPKETHQSKAIEAFKAALEDAKSGTSMTSPDNDKIKWIGYGIEALANQGLSLVEGEKAQAASYAAAAKQAATSATSTLNPDQHGNPDLAPQLRRAGIDVAG